jgi:hypothetical protein
MMNPHLFTHLFHEGVIVSTRKLVYDSGSNEDAIKSLMQAQHKAVMKDLRKGTFDDKIDQYLAGTPGLEPRAGADASAPLPRGTRAATEQSPPPEDVIAQAQAAISISEGSPLEIVNEDLSEPIELPLKGSAPPPPPPEDDAPTLLGSGAAAQPAQARTKTAERTSTSQVRQQTPPAGMRAATPPPVPTRAGSQVPRDSGPLIEIIDEESGRRGPRDTAVEEFVDGIPQQRDPSATIPVQRQHRPASHGAAALPPMKSPSRPSIQPPVVQSRAGTPSDEDLSAPVEIYAPAPPSVEPPPGERSERPGQYSVSRKDGQAPIREKTGRIAAINPNSIPAGLSRPRQGGSGQVPVVQSKSGSGAVPVQPTRESSAQIPQGRSQTPSNQPRVPTPQQAPSNRVPTPQSVGGRVHVTAPIANRPNQGSGPNTPNPSSGVVMTRPAVIVGSPQKPPAPPPTQQRVRKAREDEGRGFGQGLISEKSLDEVILAYLSEDAEDK